MARKYTNGSFVIQTTANISSQRGKSVDQIPFSLIPFTAKSMIASNEGPTPPNEDKAYIVAQRANPRDFLFEVEKMNVSYREVTDNTTATSGDRIIATDTSSSSTAITVTLPTAASVRSGFILTVKDIGGATETYYLTISAAGGNTIDGSASIQLIAPYSSVDLISDGSSAWYVI